MASFFLGFAIVALVIGSFLVFFPVGQVLSTATRRRSPLRHFIAKLFLASIGCVWFIGATVAAGNVYAWLQNKEPESREPESREPGRVVYLVCEIFEATKSIDVVVALYNSSDEPLTFGSDSLTVRFAWYHGDKIPLSARPVRLRVVGGAGGVAPVVVVNPGQSTWLQLAPEDIHEVEGLLHASVEGIREAERVVDGSCTVRIDGSEELYYGGGEVKIAR